MIRLEYNMNNEWLIEFSAVDFDGVDELDQQNAADAFTDWLVNRLEDAGFRCEPARGQRATCHGWNGANTFRHKVGPIGTFDELSEDQIATIQECIDASEDQMRKCLIDF